MYCTTRIQQVESLITHGITDKAAYLSKATKLRLFVISSLTACSFMHSITCKYYNTHIISRDDAIYSPSNWLQTTYGIGLTVSAMQIAVNVHSM